MPEARYDAAAGSDGRMTVGPDFAVWEGVYVSLPKRRRLGRALQATSGPNAACRRLANSPHGWRGQVNTKTEAVGGGGSAGSAYRDEHKLAEKR
jgi:hypothetical protein